MTYVIHVYHRNSSNGSREPEEVAKELVFAEFGARNAVSGSPWH